MILSEWRSFWLAIAVDAEQGDRGRGWRSSMVGFRSHGGGSFESKRDPSWVPGAARRNSAGTGFSRAEMNRTDATLQIKSCSLRVLQPMIVVNSSLSH